MVQIVSGCEPWKRRDTVILLLRPLWCLCNSAVLLFLQVHVIRGRVAAWWADGQGVAALHTVMDRK